MSLAHVTAWCRSGSPFTLWLGHLEFLVFQEAERPQGLQDVGGCAKCRWVEVKC